MALDNMSLTAGLARALALAAATTLPGCSLVVDAEREQCSTDLDCRVRGAAFAEALCIDSLCQADPTWACVDSLSTPPEQAPVEASLSLVSFFDRSPIPGVHATLFSGLDLELRSPLDTADTDAEGRATLSVPANFEGLVRLDADGVIEPTLYYPTLPVSAATGLGQVFAGTPGGSANLAGLIGAVPQAERGIALVTLQDCNAGGGAGATLVFSGETQGSTPFYAFNGLASSSARAFDQTGQAGIVNLRPGVVGIEARWGDKTVSSASVLVRADHATLVTLLPGRAGQGFGAQ
ncbi:MAG TPA: hypothetical protein VNN80_36375 [Polyangiaceae bacterium]|jgi:hypothetical protein|nr:hypothetical protein [Polyangiaceae bacterium]